MKDSNLRPPLCKNGALPTELNTFLSSIPHYFNFVREWPLWVGSSAFSTLLKMQSFFIFDENLCLVSPQGGPNPNDRLSQSLKSIRVKGLEPLSSTWKDDILPLYYTRSSPATGRNYLRAGVLPPLSRVRLRTARREAESFWWKKDSNLQRENPIRLQPYALTILPSHLNLSQVEVYGGTWTLRPLEPQTSDLTIWSTYT